MAANGEGEGCSQQALSAASSRAERQPADAESQSAAAEVFRICFERSQDMEMARRAADAYIRAAELSLEEGEVRHTREISELLAALNDSERLHKVFESFLGSTAAQDRGNRYLILMDYADALAGLGAEEQAWRLFGQAIDLRPQNNIEAINRYARHLIDLGRPEKAAELLGSRLTREQRLRHVHPVYLWREARQRAGMDTAPAEEEIRLLESQGRGSPTRQRSQP